MIIESVNGVVQPGQADPTTLRVTGKASQCATGTVIVTTTVTAASGPVVVDPVTERWRVDLPITTPGVHCGAVVNVHAVCDGTPVCFDDASGPLACCEITALFFRGLTVPGSLTPSQLLVQGTVRGCAGDQVLVTSTVTAASPPVTADPATGAFTVTLPITTAVVCDAGVSVTVTCATTNGCQLTRKGRLECAECYRAAVTVTNLPCVGVVPNQKQPIRFDSVIAIAGGASITFHWDYGDGAVSPDFTINNVAGTGASSYPHSDTHDYAPRPQPYTATLRVVGPPFECSEFSRQVVAQCGGGGACPQAVPDPPQVAGQCVNGKRTVILDALVTAQAGQPVFGQWDFGDGALGAAKVVGAATTGSVQDQHDYAAPGPGQSSYTARFKIASPAGCPDIIVPVVVAPCTCTAQIQNINVAIGPCNPNGTRTVTATAVPANIDPADVYYWTWDATPAVGMPAAQAMTQTHDYPAPGTGQTSYTVTLTVVRNPTCAHSFSRPVVIDGCGAGVICPRVTGIVATAGNCAAGATTRPVT